MKLIVEVLLFLCIGGGSRGDRGHAPPKSFSGGWGCPPPPKIPRRKKDWREKQRKVAKFSIGSKQMGQNQ